jgi:hypothetical protein
MLFVSLLEHHFVKRISRNMSGGILVWLLLVGGLLTTEGQCADGNYGIRTYAYDGNPLAWVSNGIMYEQTINDTTSTPVAIPRSHAVIAMSNDAAYWISITEDHSWYSNIVVVGGTATIYKPYLIGPDVQFITTPWQPYALEMVTNMVVLFNENCNRQDCPLIFSNISRADAYSLHRFQATPLNWVLTKDSISGRLSLFQCFEPGKGACVREDLSIPFAECSGFVGPNVTALLSVLGPQMVVGTACGILIQFIRKDQWVQQAILINDAVFYGAITGVLARAEGVYFSSKNQPYIYFVGWGSSSKPIVSMRCQ